MRLLIIGGSGLVGSHVMRAAAARGHRAAGTYRANPEPGLKPLNAARLEDFEALLEAERPEVVVHAAGWTWVDGCEDDPERAMEENCHQPVRMAAACRRRGIRFAYFSTSYVFDGQAGPYVESDAPRPLNAYARSKREAERLLDEATNGQVLLPRIICVYGVEARRKNFAYQVLDALRAGKTLKLPFDQSGNPTWAGDIAAALIPLLETGATGVWHLAGPDPECGRVEWAERLVAAFGEAGVAPHAAFRIEGVSTASLGQRAPRPLRAGMLSHRAAEPFLPARVSPEVFRAIAGGG